MLAPQERQHLPSLRVFLFKRHDPRLGVRVRSAQGFDLAARRRSLATLFPKLPVHHSQPPFPASAWPLKKSTSRVLSMSTAPRIRPGSLTEMKALAAFAAETRPERLKPVNRHRPFADGRRRNSASAMGAGSKRCSMPCGRFPATDGRLVVIEKGPSLA